MATLTIIPDGDEFTRDGMLNMVFTTFFDGAVSYGYAPWVGMVKEYKWAVGRTNGGPFDYRMVKEFHATIVEDNYDGEPGETHLIDRAVIARGIKRAYNHYKSDHDVDSYQWRAISDLNFGQWEDVDFDATTAHIIVQFGLFNELVYG